MAGRGREVRLGLPRGPARSAALPGDRRRHPPPCQRRRSLNRRSPTQRSALTHHHAGPGWRGPGPRQEHPGQERAWSLLRCPAAAAAAGRRRSRRLVCAQPRPRLQCWTRAQQPRPWWRRAWRPGLQRPASRAAAAAGARPVRRQRRRTLCTWRWPSRRLCRPLQPRRQRRQPGRLLAGAARRRGGRASVWRGCRSSRPRPGEGEEHSQGEQAVCARGLQGCTVCSAACCSGPSCHRLLP